MRQAPASPFAGAQSVWDLSSSKIKHLEPVRCAQTPQVTARLTMMMANTNASCCVYSRSMEVPCSKGHGLAAWSQETFFFLLGLVSTMAGLNLSQQPLTGMLAVVAAR